MKYYVVLILCALTFAGCSSGIRNEMRRNVFNNDDTIIQNVNMSRLIIYRKYNVYGCMQSNDIYVNDIGAGTARNDEYFICDVKPGEQRVSAKQNIYGGENILLINVRPNEIAYINVYLTDSAILGKAEIRVVDKIIALEDLNKIGKKLEVIVK